MSFVASSIPPDSYKLRKIPPSVNSLFNVIAHTGKQLRQFKFSAHSLIVAMLSHRAFVSKVDQRSISRSITVYHIYLSDRPPFPRCLHWTQKPQLSLKQQYSSQYTVFSMSSLSMFTAQYVQYLAWNEAGMFSTWPGMRPVCSAPGLE